MNSNFDPEEARLFKIKRFGSTSSAEKVNDHRLNNLSSKTFGLRDDSVQKPHLYNGEQVDPIH